jgi:hypothetical protein
VATTVLDERPERERGQGGRGVATGDAQQA